MKRRHSASELGSDAAEEGEAAGVSGATRGREKAEEVAFNITETERLEFLEMYGFEWAPEEEIVDEASEAQADSMIDGESAQLRGMAERARKMRRTGDDAPGGLQFESGSSDVDSDSDSDSSDVDEHAAYRPPKRPRGPPGPASASDVNAPLGHAALGPDEEPGMRKAVSYEHYYDQLLERLEKKFEMVMTRAADVYDKNDYTSMEDLGALAKTGDEVIDDLERCFAFMDANGFRRSKQQRSICDIFIRGCLRHIYKEELRTDLIRIFRQFGIRRINNMVMVTMPRRCGKTTITSIFVAAYLLCVPNAKTVVYSISRRTSSMLSAKVLQFLSMMQPEGWHPKIHNQENIAFVNNAGTWASLASYPAAERIKGRMDFADIRTIDEQSAEGPLVGSTLSIEDAAWSETTSSVLWIGLIGVSFLLMLCSIGSASVAWTQRQRLRRSLSKSQFFYDITHPTVMPFFHREKRGEQDEV